MLWVFAPILWFVWVLYWLVMWPVHFLLWLLGSTGRR